MVHPNLLDQQIENLRTLQQSYDQIATAAEAYNVGKTQLAAAITSKGVETYPTETYPEMAEKVNAISQETYQINGGEMYAKQLFGSLETPNYWNLYDVLAQLLSDGRLVNYGGILLAEYYRGYDSLALSGAGTGGAYVVSDKNENGQFKMYTEDTTHVWDTEFDGKGNRWVAYCFADEYHDFQITNTNTSPRSIFIGRKVGTITLLVNSRCSKIVVPDGNALKNISGNFTSQWNKIAVFRNFEELSGPVIYQNPSTELVYIHAKKLADGPIMYANTNSELKTLILDIENPNSKGIFGPINCNFSALNTLVIKATGEIRPGTVYNSADARLSALKNLVIISESLNFYSESTDNLPSTTTIQLHYITNDKIKKVVLSAWSMVTMNFWKNVKNVELQDGWCKPVTLTHLTSLTEANMYAHILQRLKQDEPDCGDGVTITLGSTNLAKLTSDESVQLLDDLTNIYGYTFA